MAKFFNGSLVLSSVEEIIQNDFTILNNSAQGFFNSLQLVSTATSISEFSTDTTLDGNSNTALPTEQAVKTYVDTKISGLNPNKIWQLDTKVEVTDTGSNGLIVFQTNGLERARIDDTSFLITNNATITGNLIVNGTTFTLNAQTVLIEDNLLVINKNEIGAGVTAGISGIEVERGSVTNYQFLFDEPQDNFRVGISGALQAVSTREDTPISNGLSFWNSSAYRMDTNENLTFSSNVLSAPYLKATGTTKITGAFYAGTTAPTNTNRLNYDGYFYSTRVYVGDLFIGNTQISSISTDSSLVANSDTIISSQRAIKTYIDTILEGQFYERLLDSSIYLSSSVDTFRTTTDVDTVATTMIQSVANHMYSATASGQILQSNNLYNPSVGMATITQALLYVDYSATGHTFQLSANGGTNWETVTPNEVYYFINTGLDLRIKITSGTTDDFRSYGVFYNPDFTQPVAMTRWKTINANYSAQDGDKLLVKTVSSAITITLPSVPSIGNEIRIVDASINFGTNNCTLLRNGNKIEESVDDCILDVDRADTTLVYIDSTTGWRVIND